MKARGRFKTYRDDAWTLSVLSENWGKESWAAVLERIDALSAAKHPQTLEIDLPGTEAHCFLKVFHSASGAGAFKDFFRVSKAVRALRAGEALREAGFNVARTIAAGEERRRGVLRRAFLLTTAMQGAPLPAFLRDNYGTDRRRRSFSLKVDSIRRLAAEIRRFHDLGFVHGDLIPPNILVVTEEGSAPRFCFLDNDRTRRYPAWLPQQLWKRNLIQLNRFPLAGISLQDRIRFFHFYTGRQKLLPRDVRLARWFEARTRRRRKECDAIDVSGSFRALMQWRPPLSAGS
jgi:hypothetical protein